MAKLHFSLDGNSLGDFALDKERMTIGRRPANDIHIDNLAVSGEHAVITTIGNDSFLEDMNSTNGTLVNSKAVKKHVLHNNDVIEFGKYQLLYINEAQAKAPVNTSGFENTVVMRPAKLLVASPEAKPEIKELAAEAAPVATDVVVNEVNQASADAKNEVSQNAVPANAANAANAAESSPRVGRLQMLSGSNVGRELTLNKALTTLGKPGMQVAVVTKRPLGYFITHVEGENLPLVNGQKIGLQAYALTDHDVIDLSGIKMEFFLS